MLNSVAETIPLDPGLNSFKINGCWDANTVDQWPIQQIANKAENCKKLILETFWGYRVPEEVRGRWLDMANQLCQTSTKMEHLELRNTATTAEQGAVFLQDLADSDLKTLKLIDFSGGKQVMVMKNNKQEFVNNDWFNGRQEPVDALVTSIKRQTNL